MSIEPKFPPDPVPITNAEMDWASAIGEIPLPESMSLEQVLANLHKRAVYPFNAFRDHNKSMNVFPSVSLNRWVQLAAAAGVPHVPASVAYLLPKEAFVLAEECRPEDQVHWDALKKLGSEIGPNEMLRWDCCASYDLKHRMSTVKADVVAREDGERDPDNASTPPWRWALSPMDPRAFDIVPEYPAECIPVMRRPWINARMAGTHPVEYRVFVQDGQVIGLANYYLQRDLALDDTVRSEIEAVLEEAGKLVQLMASEGHSPWTQRQYEEPTDTVQGASCSMDFLITDYGQALFLEAGPPFGLGAHPCAFVRHDQATTSVNGVALISGGEILPLSEFAPKTAPTFQESPQ